MDLKKVLMLSVFCFLLVAFIGTAAADNVQKCLDCIESKNVSDGIHPRSPALYIDKENTTTTLIEQGGTITFRLNVSNQGGKPAYDVVVRDIINVTGFEYVAGSQVVYGNNLMYNVPYSFASGSNNTVFEWTFQYVPQGAQFYINVTLKAVSVTTTNSLNTSNATSEGCINNTAFVNGTYGPFQDCYQKCMENGPTDTDCQAECPHYIGFSEEGDATDRVNNQSTWLGENENNSCILITPTTTIAITKTVDNSSVEVCQLTSYTINVTQTGSSNPLAVAIQDNTNTGCGGWNTSVTGGDTLNTSVNVPVQGKNTTYLIGWFNQSCAGSVCTDNVNGSGKSTVPPFPEVSATSNDVSVTIRYPNIGIEKDIITQEKGKNKYRVRLVNHGTGVARSLHINDTLPYDPNAGSWVINVSTIQFSADCKNNATGNQCTTNGADSCWGGQANDTANNYANFTNITVYGSGTCTITYWTNYSGSTGAGIINKACIVHVYDNCTNELMVGCGIYGVQESDRCAQAQAAAAQLYSDMKVNKSVVNLNTTNSPDDNTAQSGDILNYTITVTNTGSIALQELKFTHDILPQGFEYVDASDCLNDTTNVFSGKDMYGVQSEAPSGRSYVTDSTRLEVGESITCWYTVRVKCDAIEGAHINQVGLQSKSISSGGATINAYRTDSAVIYIEKPMLTIEKWTNVDTIAPGSTVTIHVRVTNVGSGDAYNATVTDTQFHGYNTTAYGFTYTNATLVGGSKCGVTPQDQTITLVNIGRLNGSLSGNGDYCEYTYNATAIHGITEPALYTNKVTLYYNTSYNPDCPIATQTDEAHVFVTSDATLSVTKEAVRIFGRDYSGGVDPRLGGVNSHAEPGDFVLYQITTTNTGNNIIHNVTLVDQIPDGWFLADASSCNLTNSSNYWTIGIIDGKPAGFVTTTTVDELIGTETVYLCLNVTSNASCGPTTNKVVATAYAPDGRDLQDSDTSRNIEVIKPHLMIEKWAESGNTNPNDSVTYNVRIKNVGCNDINTPSAGTKGTAKNVWVRDYLDAWMNHTGVVTGTCANVSNSNVYPVNGNYYNAAGDGTSYVLDGGIADFNISNLEPGQECIFSYTAKVHNNAPEGLYTNLARVNYTDNNATNYLNQTASAYILVNWQMDHILLNKEISKRYLPDGTLADKGGPFIRGDVAEFDIYINNTGSRNVTINITDFVDTYTTGLDFSPIADGTHNLSTYANLNCDGDYSNGTAGIKNLTVDVSNKYTLNGAITTKVVIQDMNVLAYGNVHCRINATVRDTMIDGIHCNKVEVIGATEDGMAIQHKDQACLLTGKPHLEFDKELLTDLTHPERTVEYKVDVKNTGTALIGIANFIDDIPEGFFYIEVTQNFTATNQYCAMTELGGPTKGPVAHDGSGNPANTSTNPVIFTVINVPASCEGYFKFLVGVEEDVDEGAYTNIMWARDQPGYPGNNYTNTSSTYYNSTNIFNTTINMWNNTDVYNSYTYTNYTYWYNTSNQTSNAVAVTTDIAMLVDKYVQNSSAQPNDDVYYWIVINNTGNNTLHNVRVDDTLPLGLDINWINGSSSSGTNAGQQTAESTAYVINQTQTSINTTTGLPYQQTYTLTCTLDRVTPGQDTVNCTGDVTPGYVIIGIEVRVNTSNTSDSNEPFEGENCNKVIVTATKQNKDYEETDQACLQIKKPHLDIDKWVEGNPTKVAGTNVTYFVEVRNTGTGTAYDIRVRDSLARQWGSTPGYGDASDPIEINCPAGWNITGVEGGGEGRKPDYFWDKEAHNLLAGERCLFKYNLLVPDNATGLYENTATVTGLDLDNSVLQNATDEAYVMIVKPGPIITKEVNPKVAEPNDIVIVTLTIMNLGDRALNNIKVDDYLPTGWNFNHTGTISSNVIYDGANSYSGCNGGSSSQETDVCYNTTQYSSAVNENVHCVVSSLCENSRATITFTAFIQDAAADGVNNNIVNMSALDNGNNMYYSNSTSVSTVINNPWTNANKRLKVVKSSSKYEVEPGDNVTFTIYVMNPSGATLYNVNITDTMGLGFKYITGTSKWNGLALSPDATISPSGATGDNQAQTLNWTVSSLLPYSVNILQYQVSVGCNITGVNYNNVTVSATTANNAADIMGNSTYITINGGHSNVSITKYASNYQPSYFDYVEYTIVVRHNTTWAHVQGLNLTDVLPAGLKYKEDSLRIGDIKVYGTNNNSNSSQVSSLYDCPSQASYDAGRSGCRVIGTITGSYMGTNTTTIFLDLNGYVYLAPWEQIKMTYKVQVRTNVGDSATNTVTMNYLDPAHPELSGSLSAYSAILVPPSLGNTDASAGEVTSLGLGDSGVDSIELKAGWNLIALSVMPDNKNIDAVLSSIDGKYDSVFAYENDWMFKAKAYGEWFGSLAEMGPGKGYWVHATEDVTLLVSGNKVTSMDINLKKGWNLVGYSVQNSKALIDICPGVYSDVYGYENGDWKYKASAYGSWFGVLSSLEKNNGYWINAYEATTLAF